MTDFLASGYLGVLECDAFEKGYEIKALLTRLVTIYIYICQYQTKLLCLKIYKCANNHGSYFIHKGLKKNV